MSKTTKIEFSWSDDEIQLLLNAANQYKSDCEYEGLNWESIRSKYENVLTILMESYPKTNVEGKVYPNIENPDVISKERVGAKL